MAYVRQIAKENGWNEVEFTNFLKSNNYNITPTFTKGYEISEKQVAKATQQFKEIRDKAEAEQALIDQATSSILVSSGFNFDGYKIVKYSGYISGDDTVQLDRGVLCSREVKGQIVTDALVKIRAQALKELKEAAYALGCNAVVGVDFDYMTFEPETANINGGTTYYPYVIVVTANGNAVVIEKE